MRVLHVHNKKATLELSAAFFVPIYLAGAQGFEPQLTDPESAVLPLDDAPMRY